jgi:hypothetical protein
MVRLIGGHLPLIALILQQFRQWGAFQCDVIFPLQMYWERSILNTLSNSAEQTSKKQARIGWVKEIHPENHRVKVDFYGNAYGQPVWAALGRGFTRSEIHLAIDNQLDCRIEFVGEDLDVPILTDIYLSLAEQQELVIKAKRVVLEGKEEVTIRSGEVATKFSGNDGRITTKATYISSRAEKVHKIQGSKITLN